MRWRLICVALWWSVALAVMARAAELRTWTSADGKFSVEAKFVELQDDKAYLQTPAGKKVRIALGKLSRGDRQYVEKLLRPAESVPPEQPVPKPEPAPTEPAPTEPEPQPPAAEPAPIPMGVAEQLDWILQPRSAAVFKRVKVLEKLDASVVAIAISDDGSRLVGVSSRGDCRAWNVNTGRELARYEKELTGSRFCLAMTPDGKLALVGGEFGEVHVWDTATGKNGHTFDATNGTVRFVSTSGDGKQMGALDDTGQLVTFPILRGKGFHVELKEYGQSVTYFDLSPDARYCANGRTAEADVLVNFFPRLLVPAGNHEVLSLEGQRVISVDVGPRFAALGTEDFAVSLGQFSTPLGMPKQSVQLISRLQRAEAVDLSHSGDYLLAMDTFGGVDAWQTDAQAVPDSYRLEVTDVTSLAATADALTVAYGHLDGTVSVWRLADRPSDALRRWLRVVYERLQRGDYEDLEALAAGLRKRDFRPHWRDDIHREMFIVESLTTAWARFASRKAHIQRLEKWRTERPESQLPKLALAACSAQDAWAARGGGFASTVTAEGWKTFHAKMKECDEVLRPMVATGDASPQCYALLCEVAKAQSWDADEVDKMMKQMMKEQPLNRFAHYEVAVQRLPRWGGAVGDSEAYARAVADEIGKDVGDAMYADIALHLLHYHQDDKFFDETKFDEARVERGLMALCRAHPRDEYIYNEAFRFAWVRKHLPLAKQCVSGFAEGSTRWSPLLWGSRGRHEVALEWASQPLR